MSEHEKRKLKQKEDLRRTEAVERKATAAFVKKATKKRKEELRRERKDKELKTVQRRAELQAKEERTKRMAEIKAR